MSKNLKALAGALACLFLASATIAADEPVQLSVDPAHPGAKIDRHIFGQFAEHLGPRHLRRRLGGARFDDPEHARHPQ